MTTTQGTFRNECRLDVFKITAWRDDCVYRTKKVGDVWLPIKPRTLSEEQAIARQHGGDLLASTCDWR